MIVNALSILNRKAVLPNYVMSDLSEPLVHYLVKKGIKIWVLEIPSFRGSVFPLKGSGSCVIAKMGHTHSPLRVCSHCLQQR